MRGVPMVFMLACLFSLPAWAADGSGGEACRLRIFRITGGVQEQAEFPSDGGTPFVFVAPPAAQAAPGRRPLTNTEKFHLYLKQTYGPLAFAYSVAAAGVSQATDDVPEWGQGMEGYGKRLALRVGSRSLKSSIHSGLRILLHEDARYFTSNRSGFWTRSLFAAGQTFVAHKDSGGIRPDYSRFAGIVGATYISRKWRPQADQKFSQYVYSSAIWLGIDAAKNVVAEFWPDLGGRFGR